MPALIDRTEYISARRAGRLQTELSRRTFKLSITTVGRAPTQRGARLGGPLRSATTRSTVSSRNSFDRRQMSIWEPLSESARSAPGDEMIAKIRPMLSRRKYSSQTRHHARRYGRPRWHVLWSRSCPELGRDCGWSFDSSVPF
jgi:hypothetical protein